MRNLGDTVAVYRFSAQVIGRSTGRSATGAAAYRAGIAITDERTGLTHDYRRRGGVVHAEIVAPVKSPDWVQDRVSLWNAVEQVERRKDAQLAREILMSLPHELNEDERRALAKSFVEKEFVSRGMVADIAIHAPDREGDNRNHHAHIMLTMRSITEAGFGKKDRSWNETSLLEHWRERWAEEQNAALERSGHDVQVDHRSLEEQGINREPEPKLGPIATDMERNGKRSKAGDDLRAVWQRNGYREVAYSEVDADQLELAQEICNRAQKTLHDKERIPPDEDYLDLYNAQKLFLEAEYAASQKLVDDYAARLDGRSRVAVWWDKLRGRLGWRAEQDYEAERMRLQELRSRQRALEDSRRQEESRRDAQRQHELALREQENEFFKKQQAKKHFDQQVKPPEPVPAQAQQQDKDLAAYAEMFRQNMQRNQQQEREQKAAPKPTEPPTSSPEPAKSDKDAFLERFRQSRDRNRNQDRDREPD